MIQRYEHKLVKTNVNNPLVSVIKQFEEDGWEVAGLTGHSTSWTVVFKRPIPVKKVLIEKG